MGGGAEMKRYVTFNNNPIQFAEMGGKVLASVVPYQHATLFPSGTEAHARALQQFGAAAAAMNCTYMAEGTPPPKPAKTKTASRPAVEPDLFNPQPRRAK
jgi:hypothetical protein